jgi:hypothetical protein
MSCLLPGVRIIFSDIQMETGLCVLLLFVDICVGVGDLIFQRGISLTVLTWTHV